jgi:hypothetical protein
MKRQMYFAGKVYIYICSIIKKNRTEYIVKKKKTLKSRAGFPNYTMHEMFGH